jgi:hypothetical protein
MNEDQHRIATKNPTRVQENVNHTNEKKTKKNRTNGSARQKR